MRMLYLIGQPGSGKSTLMAALTDGWRTEPERGSGGLWVRWFWRASTTTPDAVELGRNRDAFSGTDALSMGVMPYAVAFVRGTTIPLVLGEGDRLASMKFFDAARATRDVVVVHVATTDAVAADRRRARGSAQSDAWVRGRCTKTVRLRDAAAAAGLTVVEVDGDRPTEDQTARLTSFL